MNLNIKQGLTDYDVYPKVFAENTTRTMPSVLIAFERCCKNTRFLCSKPRAAFNLLYVLLR